MTSIAVACIFVGEALSIIAELVASRRLAMGGYFSHTSLAMYAVIMLAGVLLVTGYMLGYAHLKNIWVIAAISIGSILVIEPVTAYLLFREAPTLGAWIGLILGGLGTLAALFL